MADSAESSDPGTRPDERAVARLTRRIRAFATAHGGDAEGQISYLGIRGHRLVLVGADGGWGDVVAADRAVLAAAADQAGVALRETLDGELAARLRTGPDEWSRMAGLQIGSPGDT
ncbi:hypothetical protein [Streptomyces sp. MP131-18]|uniref:hypothetical protein n=1 Tax=Streptomyces sp. MP131-18 TaxID=1857892 RepID=UPI00097CB2E2|nr:hypothetical protein [Streptomyces sp. MP131-18]ONK15179.1 hypothetical protein STBA_59940 [Streptomyces sp. MP131-18]